MTSGHTPVMLAEVITFLRLKSGSRILDATIGYGGHAEAILAATAPEGKVVGIDRDQEALTSVDRRLSEYGERVQVIHGDFMAVLTSKHEALARGFDGAVMDLGCSSMQLDDPQRGFSFRYDAPLDMRMDRSQGRTAAELLADVKVEELGRWLREYGEERWWKRISNAIIAERNRGALETTRQLAGVIEQVIPPGRRESRIHPATRTFQAIRIAVNNELRGLEEAITSVMELLHDGARLVVISFHSLEDRIVKHCFQKEAKDCLCSSEILLCQCGHTRRGQIVTRKPLRPTTEEIRANPRAHSARLRVFEILRT